MSQLKQERTKYDEKSWCKKDLETSLNKTQRNGGQTRLTDTRTVWHNVSCYVHVMLYPIKLNVMWNDTLWCLFLMLLCYECILRCSLTWFNQTYQEEAVVDCVGDLLVLFHDSRSALDSKTNSSSLGSEWGRTQSLYIHSISIYIIIIRWFLWHLHFPRIFINIDIIWSFKSTYHILMGWDGMGWEGKGWDEMGWDGKGREGMGVQWDVICIVYHILLFPFQSSVWWTW